MDYNELYRIITKYYPLGINELDLGYSEYPGIKDLLDNSNRMFDSENYEKWKIFMNSFEHETGEIKKVNWESPLSEWCYTGSLIMNKRTRDNITHIQELIICISFLAPIYTIYGRDKVEILEDGNVIEFNPFLTVSPYGRYERLFLLSKKKVEVKYSDYKLISFNLLSNKIKSIYVPGSIDGQDSTVFQALFKLHDITKFPYQGNPSYE